MATHEFCLTEGTQSFKKLKPDFHPFLVFQSLCYISDLLIHEIYNHVLQRWVIATLDDLDEDSLVEILTRPKNALVKQYQRLFDMDDVALDFTEDALRSIAHKAIARKTGARGLRSIMESILLDSMYELPGLENVEKIMVNREVVEDQSRPLYIYADRRDDIGSSA